MISKMLFYFTYTEKIRTKTTKLKYKHAILQALIFKLHFFITGDSYIKIRITVCKIFRLNQKFLKKILPISRYLKSNV